MDGKINKNEIVYNSFTNNIPSRRIRKYFLNKFLAYFGEGNGVQMNCKFINGNSIYLGNNNAINYGCVFDASKINIKLGNNISIGPEALILSDSKYFKADNAINKDTVTEIGDHSWICYRSIIFPGITIGKGAVVGAGSVVINDIEPFTIVSGNPAQIIMRRTKNLEYKISYDPWLL